MNRILHVDGDSFFASCEIALAKDKGIDLRHCPVWVGGGRRGDGIVIAANRIAKKFGVKTCMPCFEAKRLCPRGVLCRPHYEEYRRISAEMFHVLEEYSPTLVPISIDEGFLDFTTMDKVVWRNTTPEKYVRRNLRAHFARGEYSRVRRSRQFLAARQTGDGCREARLHRNQTGRGKGISARPFRARTFRHRQKPPARAGRFGRDDVWPRCKIAVAVAQTEIWHLGTATLAFFQRTLERAAAAGSERPHDDFQQHDAALRRAGL